eukprot:GHVL01040092.1.p2 GENE.GHVL01040092.1~~GHVL01040092.1.p2  ORF type:complete len:378 (-),score=91.21 GHVL01040092.1:1248-2321(-)
MGKAKAHLQAAEGRNDELLTAKKKLEDLFTEVSDYIFAHNNPEMTSIAIEHILKPSKQYTETTSNCDVSDLANKVADWASKLPLSLHDEKSRLMAVTPISQSDDSVTNDSSYEALDNLLKLFKEKKNEITIDTAALKIEELKRTVGLFQKKLQSVAEEMDSLTNQIASIEEEIKLHSDPSKLEEKSLVLRSLVRELDDKVTVKTAEYTIFEKKLLESEAILSVKTSSLKSLESEAQAARRSLLLAFERSNGIRSQLARRLRQSESKMKKLLQNMESFKTDELKLKTTSLSVDELLILEFKNRAEFRESIRHIICLLEESDKALASIVGVKTTDDVTESNHSISKQESGFGDQDAEVG